MRNRAIRRCIAANGASRPLAVLVQLPARTLHVRERRPVLPPPQWRLLLVIVCRYPLRDERNRTRHRNYDRRVKVLLRTGFGACQGQWTLELYACHVVFQTLCTRRKG